MGFGMEGPASKVFERSLEAISTSRFVQPLQVPAAACKHEPELATPNMASVRVGHELEALHDIVNHVLVGVLAAGVL